MHQNRILIADAGSSKIAWSLIKENDFTSEETMGFSPVANEAHVFQYPSFEEPETIHSLYYYGSGIIGKETTSTVEKILKKKFINATIIISEDLTGAGRATLGNQSGGIGILGTGSNSGFYNGSIAKQNVPSMGFILGDEGGGVQIGKQIIKAYYYGKMPIDIQRRFQQKYELTRAAFLNALKNHPTPNRYLASFTNFLVDLESEWKNKLVLDCFNSFLALRGEDFRKTDKNCFVGSVVNGFESLFRQACAAQHIEIYKIVKNPSEGLIKYHLEQH